MDIKHRINKARHGFVAIMKTLSPLILAFPPLVYFVFITVFGNNTIFADEWSLVPLYDRMVTGKLTFLDLFMQHNESRIFFPRIMMLISDFFTGFNVMAEIYLSFAFLCLTAFILFRAFSRGSEKHNAFFYFIPVVFLIFHLRQWESALWGFCISWYMAAAALVAAIYLASRSKGLDIKLSGAIGAAVISTFSIITGLIVWPLVLIQLITGAAGSADPRSSRIKAVAVWTIAGVFTYAAYFVNYMFNNTPGNSSPRDMILFYLACLGNIFGKPDLAVFAGACLLLVYLYLMLGAVKTLADSKKAHEKKDSLIWFCISLILLPLVFCGLVASGRSGLGIFQALASRYTLIPALGITGAYMLSITLNKGKNSPVTILLAFLMITAYMLSFYDGIIEGRGRRDIMQLYSYYGLTAQYQSDKMLYVHCPYPELIRGWTGILKKYRLNFHTDSIYTRISALNKLKGTCPADITYISGPDKKISSVLYETSLISQIVISGWAMDPESSSEGRNVFICIDGKTDIPAIYPVSDSMYVSFEKNRDNHFYAAFSTKEFGKGEHSLSVKLVKRNGSGYYRSAELLKIRVL